MAIGKILDAAPLVVTSRRTRPFGLRAPKPWIDAVVDSEMMRFVID